MARRRPQIEQCFNSGSQIAKKANMSGKSVGFRSDIRSGGLLIATCGRFSSGEIPAVIFTSSTTKVGEAKNQARLSTVTMWLAGALSHRLKPQASWFTPVRRHARTQERKKRRPISGAIGNHKSHEA